MIKDFIGFQNLSKYLMLHSKDNLKASRKQLELAAARISGQENFLRSCEASLLISEGKPIEAEALFRIVGERTENRETQKDSYLFFHSQFFLAVLANDWGRAREMKAQAQATHPGSTFVKFLPIWTDEIIERVARDCSNG